MQRNREGPVAVISGTGVTEHFQLAGKRVVKTKFGTATVFGSKGGKYVVLPRHGAAHEVPPHMIDYRANIAALGKLGVRQIIATSAVGSMRERFHVGDVGLIDQFIDFTKSRPSTFFEDRVVHTDMTRPYSEIIAAAIERAAARVGVRLQKGLVYVAVEGPRFETTAEIKMFRAQGGDVVGMTGVPEVVLARELGIEYASIAIATNRAAGSQESVTHEEVLTVMKETGARVMQLIEETVNLLRSGAR